jgi:hypothetical protein
VAIVFLEGLQKSLGDDIEVVNNLRKSRRDIDVPVCSSITYDESFKVVVLHCGMHERSLVPLMNLPCKIGNINASIAFSRDV